MSACYAGCKQEHRACTLRREHRSHHWWGRNAQRYYHCPGHHGTVNR